MTTLKQVLCYANQPEHIFIHPRDGRGRIFEYSALLLRYSCDMAGGHDSDISDMIDRILTRIVRAEGRLLACAFTHRLMAIFLSSDGRTGWDED